MVSLLATLFGDVARLLYSTPVDNEEEGSLDEGAGGRTQGVGYVLSRSFGKIMEIGPVSAGVGSCRGASAGLRCLQLSLEEAFYLVHVDKCLGLVLADVPSSPTALSSRKRPFGAEEAPPTYHQHHRQDNEEQRDTRNDVPSEGGGAGSGDTPGRGWPRCLAVAGTGVLDTVATGGAPLSGEEAWRYCCARRSDFPAMFAVYRYFRSRSYTVHTGHKYGSHFVLYEGAPDECHSRYCVHVMGCSGGGGDSWGHVKAVTRLMPDVAKCLLVCGVTYNSTEMPPATGVLSPSSSSSPLDTSSLAALATAEVTALSLSRSSDPDVGAASDTSKKGTSAAAIVGKLVKNKKISAEGGWGKGKGEVDGEGWRERRSRQKR